MKTTTRDRTPYANSQMKYEEGLAKRATATKKIGEARAANKKAAVAGADYRGTSERAKRLDAMESTVSKAGAKAVAARKAGPAMKARNDKAAAKKKK
jgi:hypothetical protein